MTVTLHQPVMLVEVVEALAPKDNAAYIDATFGRGGYTKAVLEAADCRLAAIDRDPDAIAAGQSLVNRFPGKLTLLSGRFSQLATLASNSEFELVDGVMFDLGLSSPQIDEAERGFSFRTDGPLDMRMDRSGPDASDFVNDADEAEITRVLRDYGEERAARRIARAIIRARAEQPIIRTLQLAEIIRSVMPYPKPGQIDPATRSFQAIRIHVNDELGEIRDGLAAAERILKPGGVLAVVSFHSLEDRIVKRFMIERSDQAPRPSRHLPDIERPAPSFRITRKRP
ncbi:MAG TPA: 16S rRNA (cytosine(1402)-N(4))-methyltransferase, partial [Alphaproteobacteria bacterium]|nr:16S rRNA (cytosine(1402)-N(4))-methyltransferase [Alphaproteobacteria bacterium]